MKMNSENKKNHPLGDTEVDDKWISSKKNDKSKNQSPIICEGNYGK